MILNSTFITEIKIDKLRHLENINIELDRDEPKHLLLTGKNGVGKTTILNAMRDWMRFIQNPNIDLKSLKWSIERSEMLKENILNTHDEIEILKMKKDLNDRLKSIDSKSHRGLNINFSREVDDIKALYEAGKFVLAYYDSKRAVDIDVPKGSEKVELKRMYSFDDKPGRVFLKYLVDLKTQQSFARNEGEEAIAENIDAWFDRLLKALKIVLDDESMKLKFDYKNYNFSILQDGREPFGFDELSDGYSSIINIISDLILRMDQNRASENRDYSFDVEGIVLIDEIETHLHIDLQKKILPFLTEFFPKIQFIVTTHSPFILNSIENSVIYDLENGIRMEDFSNYSYDGIVEGYFEVGQYRDELKLKIQEYKALAFESDLSSDQRARRAELRIEFKNLSGDLAGKLKAEFDEIERKRKSLNDSSK